MNDSDKQLKKFLAPSEQLEHQIDQAVRISKISAVLYFVAVFAVSGLYFASNVTYALGSTLKSPLWSAVSNVLLFGTYGIILMSVVVGIFNKRHLATTLKQIERMAKAEGLLKGLQLIHPELFALQTAMDLLNDVKQELAERRGFWAAFGQNFFFLVLGILVSYALARLGVMR